MEFELGSKGRTISDPFNGGFIHRGNRPYQRVLIYRNLNKGFIPEEKAPDSFPGKKNPFYPTKGGYSHSRILKKS